MVDTHAAGKQTRCCLVQTITAHNCRRGCCHGCVELRRTIEPEKNIILRGSVKEAPATKKITEKRLKWHGRVERRDEGHILRITLHEYQERDGEEDRKQVKRLV